MRWPRCLPASLILCAFPPAAPAQTFVAASGGVGFAGPNPSIPGFLAQASVGHQGPSGGWRVDVFAAEGFQASKPEQFPFIVMPQMCSRSGCITRFETTPAAVPIGMAGAALSDIVPLHTSTNGTATYFIVGGETDWFLSDSTARNGVRFGVSPGVGLALPSEGRQRTFIDARLHALINGPNVPTWIFLVSVGRQSSFIKL